MSPIDRLEEIRRLLGYILMHYNLSLSQSVRLQEALLKIELAMESLEK